MEGKIFITNDAGHRIIKRNMVQDMYVREVPAQRQLLEEGDRHAARAIYVVKSGEF